MVWEVAPGVVAVAKPARWRLLLSLVEVAQVVVGAVDPPALVVALELERQMAAIFLGMLRTLVDL